MATRKAKVPPLAAIPVVKLDYSAIFSFENTDDRVSPQLQAKMAFVAARMLHLVAMGLEQVDYIGTEDHDHGILVAGTSYLDQLLHSVVKNWPEAEPGSAPAKAVA